MENELVQVQELENGRGSGIPQGFNGDWGLPKRALHKPWLLEKPSVCSTKQHLGSVFTPPSGIRKWICLPHIAARGHTVCHTGRIVQSSCVCEWLGGGGWAVEGTLVCQKDAPSSHN